MKFEKIPGGRGGYNGWTINGKSWPETNPMFTVQQGKRYRLVMDNHSGDQHPVHSHRHTFEVTKIGNQPTSGLIKDTISMPRYSTAEVKLVCRRPWPNVLPLCVTKTTWTRASPDCLRMRSRSFISLRSRGQVRKWHQADLSRARRHVRSGPSSGHAKSAFGGDFGPDRKFGEARSLNYRHKILFNGWQGPMETKRLGVVVTRRELLTGAIAIWVQPWLRRQVHCAV